MRSEAKHQDRDRRAESGEVGKSQSRTVKATLGAPGAALRQEVVGAEGAPYSL